MQFNNTNPEHQYWEIIDPIILSNFVQGPINIKKLRIKNMNQEKYVIANTVINLVD